MVMIIIGDFQLEMYFSAFAHAVGTELSSVVVVV